MEQERKQEYIGRLTLELLAYDSGAIGEAVKCRLSGADPDRLTAAALEAYNAVLELVRRSLPFQRGRKYGAGAGNAV